MQAWLNHPWMTEEGFDIVTALAGLEMVLHRLGHDVELGAGVGAAQRVFVEAGVPAPA